MRLLLDTHTFLWFILDDPALSSRAHDLIEDPENQRLASVASFWEMAIKASLGKLEIAEPFEEFVQSQLQINDINLLAITIAHIGRVRMLPFHHRDPFDRLLIAQCLVEQVPIVSVDPRFDDYGIQRLW
jgi:PIN domain nuclease of toxin-antitoxin system